jgi:ABC-type bacteriocin/lantibiotic exporter with double-glycine peptidase domain
VSTQSPTPLPLQASLRKLYSHATPRRRWQFGALLLLMLVSAVGEVVSLGAVMPFLAILADPSQVEAAAPVVWISSMAGWDDSSDLLIPVTVVFVTATLVAGALRLLLAWAGTKFIYRFSHELSCLVYSNTLCQGYSYHISHNTSNHIALIQKVHIVSAGVLLPLLDGLVSCVIALCILIVLFLIDPTIAITSAFGFGGMYVFVSWVTRSQLAANGRKIAWAETERIKTVQEGLGGVRDVILDQVQHVFLATFRHVSLTLNDSRSVNQVIAVSPRFVLETFGLALIAVLALIMTDTPEGLAGALPVLGALALGAQKLLPLLQKVYQAWAQAAGNKKIVDEVVASLDLEVPPEVLLPRAPALPFRSSVSLRGVDFAYGEGALTLKQIDLDIPKGSHLGIVGTTGSGKSTLVDLLLGLLAPTRGVVEVDSVPLVGDVRQAWQRNVAHVPQAIFLADSTIGENIAFGLSPPEIDRELIRDIAARVQLLDFIDSLPDGLDTTVGERGVRLSGGQRQRIGIARALYKKADVLVLDEATSALDGDTEKSIMSAIESLRSQLTIITIAHRETTLTSCDQIIRIEAGRIQSQGTYAEVITAFRETAAAT